MPIVFNPTNKTSRYNIHAFATWTKLPVIGGRISLTYNKNLSNYLTSDIYAIRHSRVLVKNKVNLDLYYRMANYTFLNSNRARMQQYYGANFSLRISKKLSLQIAGEANSFNQENNTRIYARIIRRFYGKK